MPKDVVMAERRGGYRVWLQFQDGVEGAVDLGPELTFQGVFGPLRDSAYFARVSVNPELGTIGWPNGAEWDPLVLLSRDPTTGRDAPDRAREGQDVTQHGAGRGALAGVADNSPRNEGEES